MAELVETIKIWKLVDAVSPTSEQKLPLLSQFNKLEKLKMQYRQQYRQSMNRLEQLQATPVDSKIELAELQSALTHYREVENGFIAERQKIMDELNQILTVEQQAQFVLFSYSYRQELRKTLQTLIALQETRAREGYTCSEVRDQIAHDFLQKIEKPSWSNSSETAFFISTSC